MNNQKILTMMVVLFLLGSPIFFSVSSAPFVSVSAQRTPYPVWGYVYMPSGHSIPAGEKVTITDDTRGISVCALTDDTGLYVHEIYDAISNSTDDDEFTCSATYDGETGSCCFILNRAANISQRCDIHLLGVAKEEGHTTSGGGSQQLHPPAITEIKTTSAGVVTESVTVTSPDEKATLMVPEGVTALNVEGNPLTQVSVATAVSIPALPPTVSLPGPAGIDYTKYAYDLGPDGATFDPPIDFSIAFDPADFTADTKPVIYTYNEEESKWEELPTEVVSNTATVKISHFTTFVLFAVSKETVSPTSILTPTLTPAPVAAQTPTVVPPVKRPWALIIGIIVAVVVAGAAVYYFYTKKKMGP